MTMKCDGCFSCKKKPSICGGLPYEGRTLGGQSALICATREETPAEPWIPPRWPPRQPSFGYIKRQGK